MKKFIVLLFILLTGCSSSIVDTSKQTLRILHTNDHHGHYLTDKYGQYGMAARKTLIDTLRASIASQGGSSLLLSGGDINTGTMESDIFDAEPDFLGMKYIGYDAMAVGNHEFDNEFSVIKKQMKWAGFPFLAANIFYKGTKNRVFKPYIVKEVQGVKIGIFGLTTKDTPFKASSDEGKKLFDFISIVDAAKEIVPVLRNKEKVDIVIAVTHVGHHGSSTSNGDIDVAKSVDGIDVIVGGHSQEVINAEVHNGTIIVQAEDWGKYVGVLDLAIDKNNKKIAHDYKLVPVNLKKKVGGKRKLIEKEIKQDPTLEKFFSTYKYKAEQLGKKVVGTLLHDLSGARKLVRSKQMPIGQFVGESLKYQVKGIDVVVLNGGSIRADLNKGPVSRKDIHNVHPYGNTIITVELSTKEFFSYMSVVAKKAIVDPKNIIGGYPQMTGVKITMTSGELTKVTSRNGDWKIEKINGKIISNKEKFTLGSMNFLGKGGDNYPRLADHKTYNDSGFMINVAMMNYVEAKKKVNTKQFRKNTKGTITIK